MLNQLLIVCSLCLIGSIESSQIGLFQDFKFLNVPQRNVFVQNDGLTTIQHVRANLGIVNGQPASPGQFCYAVYLQLTDGLDVWACTASLISPSVILTAAHCLDGATRGIAALGATNLAQATETGRKLVRFTSSTIKIHENYSRQIFYNDIGLIKISSVELTDRVCTVKVPPCPISKQPVNGSYEYTVCGWGKTSDTTTTTRLMYVNVPGEEQNSCARFYKEKARYTVIDSQMCTSGAGYKGTCNGDSGGPLAKDGVQVGIVSLGLKSCEKGAPSVYTDLTSYTCWIESKIAT